jgi:NitT/TauT family transport system permease protein
MRFPELNRKTSRLLAILFWMSVWQLAAIAVSQEFLLTSPLRVLERLYVLLQQSDTYAAALLSGGRILLGFLSGAAFGILLALLSQRFRLVRELALPLVNALRAVPVASFVVLAIILVSSSWLSTLIAFVIGFPVIYENAAAGLAQTDRSLDEMGRVYRLGAVRRLTYIKLPQLLPYLRAGALTALGLCWKSGIAAELIGIPQGTIGEKLYSVKVNYFTADLFAWTVIIVLLNSLTAYLLKRLLNAAEEGLSRL